MKIVFFDGYCGLCNASVDALMRIDRTGVLKYASLQGQTAAEVLGKTTSTIDPETVIYLRDEEKFDQSTAIFQILSDIGGVWRVARVFLLVPKPIRDFIYRIIAKNRYHLMPKRDTCRAPRPAERDRLLP